MCLDLLDITRWKQLFWIERIRQVDPWYVQGYPMITSPFHIAVIEQIRDECGTDGSTEEAAPTDVFVFAHGEPRRRDVTKIGGLPYRPSGKPWPKTSAGRDMTFVAQFRFTESLDICLNVPAQMLLLFASNNTPVAGDPDSFRFEWQELDVPDLATPDEMPRPGWTFVQCYGVRHRTMDLPGHAERFDRYGRPYCVDVLQGTKIGGVPMKSPPPPPGIAIPDDEPQGKFLCSLGSIECVLNWPYPWLNEPDAIGAISNPWRTPEEDETLYWGDAGTLNFYLGRDNSISWDLFSY